MNLSCNPVKLKEVHKIRLLLKNSFEWWVLHKKANYSQLRPGLLISSCNATFIHMFKKKKMQNRAPDEYLELLVPFIFCALHFPIWGCASSEHCAQLLLARCGTLIKENRGFKMLLPKLFLKRPIYIYGKYLSKYFSTKCRTHN